jgi:hypothetical protein
LEQEVEQRFRMSMWPRMSERRAEEEEEEWLLPSAASFLGFLAEMSSSLGFLFWPLLFSIAEA